MCECYCDDVRRDIAREEIKAENGKWCLYRCLQCGYGICTWEGRHYCPVCSTLYERVPLARIVEQWKH